MLKLPALNQKQKMHEAAEARRTHKIRSEKEEIGPRKLGGRYADGFIFGIMIPSLGS